MEEDRRIRTKSSEGIDGVNKDFAKDDAMMDFGAENDSE